jgi:hypothetical protein
MVGVDTHKHIDVAAVMESIGGILANLTIATDTAGFRQLLEWASSCCCRTSTRGDCSLGSISTQRRPMWHRCCSRTRRSYCSRAVRRGWWPRVARSLPSIDRSMSSPPPPYALNATVAGDAFTAGFLAALLRDADLTDAARAGIETAGSAISIVGGRPRHN